MILNTAPQDQAILSNVGQIGEFRIRNSAKAFNILSSGLYANKIRAIIRELSCNAVDSHTAANNSECPFDIHLPNQLEPWFSIRDYGTGLTHDQVTNIYTTYFESTKTDSNAFIGALGLGSKSPFSYTDNFTVTAIKDGRKGVYTAFINDQGVPSIALMAEEDSTDPSGVEVKFAVSNTADYEKFRQEATNVYTYFALRPVVTGNSKFQFFDPTYRDRDIIPGIHSIESNKSVAVMGNIAYPIEIPESDKSLGELRGLLNCGLVIHFGIGELDFQASREGLSYVPLTVNSIRAKLSALNAALTVKLTAEANAISNLWERALYLVQRRSTSLWRPSVFAYIKDTNFSLLDSNGMFKHPHFFTGVLAELYNIKVRPVRKDRDYAHVRPVKFDRYSEKDDRGNTVTRERVDFRVSENTVFVINDSKQGGMSRVKYHWHTARKFLNGNPEPYETYVYLLEPADKKRHMMTAAFFAAIQNPPKSMIMDITALREDPDKASSGNTKAVSILRLTRNDSRRNATYTWTDAGSFDTFDSNKTYYYVPLNHFQCDVKYKDIKELQSDLNQSGIFAHVVIHGVRKADLDCIKLQKNWINVEDYLKNQFANIDHKKMLGFIVNSFDSSLFRNDIVVSKITNSMSPYLKFVESVKSIQPVSRYNRGHVESLLRVYGVGTNFSFDALEKGWKQRYDDVLNRYSMFKIVSSYSVNPDIVAEYVNMVDQQKGCV